MYYENFEKLCKENNVKPATVSKATGVPTSTLTNWKQGNYTPKQITLQPIADYFNVSVDYLMTGKEPQFDYLYTDENADFLVEVTKMAKNQEFVERMMKYMSLMKENKKSVDDMIDYMYDKENPKEEG